METSSAYKVERRAAISQFDKDATAFNVYGPKGGESTVYLTRGGVLFCTRHGQGDCPHVAAVRAHVGGTTHGQ